MSVIMNTSDPAMYGFDNAGQGYPGGAGAPRFNAPRGYPQRQTEDALAAQMAGLGFQDDSRGPRANGGYGMQQQAAAFSPPNGASPNYPSRQPGAAGQMPNLYTRPLQAAPNMPGPLAAFTALNQKVSTAQQLARLNGWTLDEAVARLGGFSPDEIRMLQAAATNNGAASMQQAQLAQQQALAAREEQLRHLQALQAQLVQQQTQNMAMQLPPPGSYGAESLFNDRQGGRVNDSSAPGSAGPGDVASAYEQRQVAKQQLEANLKARSSSRPPAQIDLPPRSMQGGPLSPTWPLVPRTHTASPARSDASAKQAGSPTASTGSGKFEGPQGRNKEASSASSKSSPKSSLGPGSARSEQFPGNRDTRAGLPLKVSVHAGYISPTPMPPNGAAAVGFSIVLRQPRGPPAGADELGDANFASRIRQKASINLSSALSRRTEIAVA